MCSNIDLVSQSIFTVDHLVLCVLRERSSLMIIFYNTLLFCYVQLTSGSHKFH